MDRLFVVDLENKTTVADRVVVAQSFAQRLVGLLGKRSFPNDSALWITNCDSIHTFFMKFPIGAVFVDHQLRVKKVIEEMPPFRCNLPVFGAKSVFEFSTSNEAFKKLKKGDQLYVGP